ncbi:hypothetical protein Pint_14887 [Pistacia integerrima]|uniref:Uncharacterized protein n=1 Tax=Pistacia integerrima TaxID=434235 RepID=A0ACC0Z854_9ROSI|nr:hypothetical protein Pint_14887 [Pistacia integerrima]
MLLLCFQNFVLSTFIPHQFVLVTKKKKKKLHREETMASASSVSGPQKSSTYDEFFMQQSLHFADTLKDLKNLRKQLYSAADFFEISYSKEAQKRKLVEGVKDYAIKALINTVDHLGSVAFKVNNLFDEKIGEASETGLRLTCLEQVLEPFHSFVQDKIVLRFSEILQFLFFKFVLLIVSCNL